jgi:hypothetical protein
MIVGSAAAGAALSRAGVPATELLSRHATGDHGEVEASERAANTSAILAGSGSIVSIYQVSSEEVVVLTEADRSMTTLFIPLEW